MSVTPRVRLPRAGRSRLLSDRRVAFAGAAGAAALAGVLLVSGGSKNSSTPSGAAAPSVSVVVAGKVIHKGAALDASAVASTLKTRDVAARDAQAGSVATIAALDGKVAARDIYPGQQVTSAALRTSDGSITSELSGTHRGVSLPIDKVNGMVGDVADGDRVDVYASFKVKKKDDADDVPVLRLIASDVPVLHAPKPGGGGSASGQSSNAQVTLDLTSKVAQRVAFTADYGKLWIAARPASGAPGEVPSLVTVNTLLQNVKPMSIGQNGGAQR